MRPLLHLNEDQANLVGYHTGDIDDDCGEVAFDVCLDVDNH